MKTFAIQYGFAEGPKIAQKFITDLTHDGWELTSVETADIIIAHSGGSRVIPEINSAESIVLVNISPWPEVSLLGALTRKLTSERFSASKVLWNFWYGISNIPYAFSMKRNYSLPPANKTIIIRNIKDTYMPKKRLTELSAAGYEIIELPGTHDDIWENPTSYINIIDSLR